MEQYSSFLWLGLMLVIFYFLLIRPQKKKEKSDRMMRSNLQPGDQIVTIGGFTGRILSIRDDVITFETGADRTKLAVKKWAIQTKEGPVSEDKETNNFDEDKKSKKDELE